ncbi:phenylacetate--CoA ligase family protein [Deinococcus cellulosilyticus]|uniref:Coenzyme F390 synthetase n=1 Tax=Deinococcus cellulosilyticus (strain DSM 18568 / NBRC 106333 / KACC 11606 / 5516J-15) TaxID=1223518 RepID=A0A511N2N9_DEIC1|nr:phenylacetate--CoA ligase family protein [Deinococcus cellulosilyticus]GEM46681.1 coenzyme F390 synthetase [Deinococcus cellulosilyticus NBRC 106333 = KACC 11606]
MKLRQLLPLLHHREVLISRDRWSREALLDHQKQALQHLIEHAVNHSPYYRHLYGGRTDLPLEALPVITKKELMEHFDQVVTDTRLTRAELERHLQGDLKSPHLGTHQVCMTSGTSGLRGIFPFNEAEWLMVMASYARAYSWAGATPTLFRHIKMAVGSTTTRWHQSLQVGETAHSPFVPTLRLDVTDPLVENVVKLNPFQPDVLVAYSSMGRQLALEQQKHRLDIHPKVVMLASEVLTDSTRKLIEDTWGVTPFNVYGLTEGATVAAECPHHRLHVFEDLVIAEVVDEQNRPVPVGEVGSKVLLTVLFGRTLPLIRYEVTDRLVESEETCPCGMPYRTLRPIEGRKENPLRLQDRAGRWVEVHPNLFEDVLGPLPVGPWQVGVQGRVLHVHVSGDGVPDVQRQAVQHRLQKALQQLGLDQQVQVHFGREVKRGLSGKPMGNLVGP